MFKTQPNITPNIAAPKTAFGVQPMLSEIYNFYRFKGRYFLSGFVQKLDKQGEPFVKITVSDSTDTANLYCRDQSCIKGDLAPESFVNIEVQLDCSGNKPYFRLKFIELCEANRPKSMKQLPLSRCMYPSALFDLFNLVESIESLELKQFVDDVLCIENIGVRFIQCPASVKHHHNYYGGLLVHSLEVAKLVAANENLSWQDRDLAIVAAIFHDIGKTLTLSPSLHLTDIGLLVAHDQLTLEICSGALTHLQLKNADCAMQLRHAWTCEVSSAKHSYKAKTKVARALKKADGISAFAQQI